MLLLPTFDMSQYHQGGPSDHILRLHLVEHTPRILLFPQFVYISKCTHDYANYYTGDSTSGQEMQIIFSPLQSTKDGLRPWHGVLVLQIPWGMLKEQNPAVFFELGGKDSVSDFQFQ